MALDPSSWGALLDDLFGEVADDRQLEHLALISFVSGINQSAEHSQKERQEKQDVENPH